MKKLIGVLILVLIIASGCTKSSGTLTCKSNITSDNSTYKIKMESKVTYKNNIVERVTTKEEITTTTVDQATSFKELLDNAYSKYNEITGFTNVIEQKDKVIISKTTIDYKNIATEKLISIDESNKNLIKDGKVSLEDMKKNLEASGATCK